MRTQAKYIHPHWLAQAPTTAQLKLIPTTNHDDCASIACPTDFGSRISNLTKTARIPRLSQSSNEANPQHGADKDSLSVGMTYFFARRHMACSFTDACSRDYRVYVESNTRPSKPLPTRTTTDASAISNPGPATKQGRHKKDPRIVSPLEASAQQKKRKGGNGDVSAASGKKVRAEPQKKGGKGNENGTQLIIYSKPGISSYAQLFK